MGTPWNAHGVPSRLFAPRRAPTRILERPTLIPTEAIAPHGHPVECPWRPDATAVYIHACRHTHTHACMHTRRHTRMHASVCECMCVYACACVCIFVCVHRRQTSDVCACVCVRTVCGRVCGVCVKVCRDAGAYTSASGVHLQRNHFN